MCWLREEATGPDGARYLCAGSSVLVTWRKGNFHNGNTKSRPIRTSCTFKPPNNVT